MSGKEIWQGKPFSRGIQELIVDFLLGRDGFFASVPEIADAINRNTGSVTSSLSELCFAGWVERDPARNGYFRAVDPSPVEDRNNMHIPERRRHSPRRTTAKHEPADYKVGDCFIVKCVFVVDGRPIFQEDDGDGSIFQIVKVRLDLR
jgi:hypothetical protein